MNKADREKIEKLLHEQRREIEHEVVSHGGLRADESNSDFKDPEDRAAGLGDALLDSNIANRDMNLIEKIDFALQRLEEGTYEKCASCGKDIPIERLMAKPSASLCVDCQAAKEV